MAKTTYDIFGYLTVKNFNDFKPVQPSYHNIENGLTVKKEALKIAKEALARYEVVKVTDHEDFNEVLFRPGCNPEAPAQKKHYNVWVEIEEIDENGDAHDAADTLGILPDKLGSFDTVEAAMARVAEINSIFCADPQNSDCRPGAKPPLEIDKETTVCDECGAPIPTIEGGTIENKHHQTTCSLYDAEKD